MEPEVVKRTFRCVAVSFVVRYIGASVSMSKFSASRHSSHRCFDLFLYELNCLLMKLNVNRMVIDITFLSVLNLDMHT